MGLCLTNQTDGLDQIEMMEECVWENTLSLLQSEGTEKTHSHSQVKRKDSIVPEPVTQITETLPLTWVKSLNSKSVSWNNSVQLVCGAVQFN